MSCEDVREELVALLDGELDDAAAEAVRSHLESCHECEEESRALATAREAIDVGLGRGVPVASRFDELWAAATSDEEPESRGPSARRTGGRAGGGRVGRGRMASWTLAAAAAAVVVFWFGRTDEPRSPDQPDAARVATVESLEAPAVDARLPPELADHPDMFVDFVIVRRLEKLRQLPDLLDDPSSASADVGRT